MGEREDEGKATLAHYDFVMQQSIVDDRNDPTGSQIFFLSLLESCIYFFQKFTSDILFTTWLVSSTCQCFYTS